jgi:hypothetical protein
MLWRIFVSLGLLLFSASVALAGEFSDVSESDMFFDAVEYVQEQGIVEGYEDGTFGVDFSINRAEFTKIIMEALFPRSASSGPSAGESVGSDCFSDVTDAWFAAYVCTAKKKGIIGGYEHGTFQPNREVAFSESAKILVEAFGYKVAKDNLWFRPYVESLAFRSAIPVTITSFNKSITRGEMAEMVYRLHAGIADRWTHTYKTLENSGLITIEGLGDNWISYSHSELGFSLHIPAVSEVSGCEIEGIAVSDIQVFPSASLAIVAAGSAYELTGKECVKKRVSVNDLLLNVASWEMKFEDVENEEALEALIRSEYGSSCTLAAKEKSSQAGTYDITIGGGIETSSLASLSGELCFVNWIYVMKYSPARKRVAYWNIGQDSNFFYNDTALDNAMAESFRFE